MKKYGIDIDELDEAELFGYKLAQAFESANASIALLAEDGPSRDGFVCVNEAADTWLPKDLYEGRLSRAKSLARQPERIPLKPISRKEKHLARRGH